MRNRGTRVRSGLLNIPQPMMVAIIIGCLLTAGVVFYVRYSRGSGMKRFKHEGVWVKCENPECMAEYQMNKLEYYRIVDAHPGTPIPLLTMACEKCGKNTLHKAVKCPKCGHVFGYGRLPTHKGDFADRCPECGYSEREQMHKR